MSYSRWGHSKWYTYWHACSGNTANSQIFDVCNVTQFSYFDIKNYLPTCLEIVKKLEPTTSSEELDELKVYMLSFVKDVEFDFRSKDELL